MKNFFKENFWWLILALITLSMIVCSILLPSDNIIMKIILIPCYAIGALTIIVGVYSIIDYLDKKKFFTEYWQGCLIFLILAFSIISLAIL
jgi:uncharacterized membrane protein HdeD (DUF308 family)